MAFEPIPALALRLTAEFPDVEVHGLALADEQGELDFHVAHLQEWSGLRPRRWLDAEYEQITVPVRRLDSIVPEERTIDFIKVDVEGAQVLVLRGADGILSRDRPAIWLEHGQRSAGAYDTTSRDLWDLLVVRHGYRLWTADGKGPLDFTGLDAANDLPMWTFMAHP